MDLSYQSLVRVKKRTQKLIVEMKENFKKENLLLLQNFINWEEAKLLENDALQIVFLGPKNSGKTSALQTLFGIPPIRDQQDRIYKFSYTSKENSRVEVFRSLQEYSKSYRKEYNSNLSSVGDDKNSNLHHFKSSINFAIDLNNCENGEQLSNKLNEEIEIGSALCGGNVQEQFVIIYWPSEVLKLGIECYDTPGNTFESECFTSSITTLFQVWNPYVVLCYDNPAFNGDTLKVYRKLDAIVQDREYLQKPFFLNTKFDIKTILEDENMKVSGSTSVEDIQSVLKKNSEIKKSLLLIKHPTLKNNYMNISALNYSRRIFLPTKLRTVIELEFENCLKNMLSFFVNKEASMLNNILSRIVNKVSKSYTQCVQRYFTTPSDFESLCKEAISIAEYQFNLNEPRKRVKIKIINNLKNEKTILENEDVVEIQTRYKEILKNECLKEIQDLLSSLKDSVGRRNMIFYQGSCELLRMIRSQITRDDDSILKRMGRKFNYYMSKYILSGNALNFYGVTDNLKMDIQELFQNYHESLNKEFSKIKDGRILKSEENQQLLLNIIKNIPMFAKYEVQCKALQYQMSNSTFEKTISPSTELGMLFVDETNDFIYVFSNENSDSELEDSNILLQYAHLHLLEIEDILPLLRVIELGKGYALVFPKFKTLSNCLIQNEHFSPSDVKRFIQQVGFALLQLHNCYLIHGNLNISSIFVAGVYGHRRFYVSKFGVIYDQNCIALDRNSFNKKVDEEFSLFCIMCLEILQNIPVQDSGPQISEIVKSILSLSHSFQELLNNISTFST